MRQLLKIAKTADSARIVQSITLVTVILGLLSLVNAILTTTKPDQQFQLQVPIRFSYDDSPNIELRTDVTYRK